MLLYVLADDKLIVIVATVNFSQSLYSVDENGGSVEIVMILSNPSPSDITVQVLNTEGSATGKSVFFDIVFMRSSCMQVKTMTLLCHTVLYFMLG